MCVVIGDPAAAAALEETAAAEGPFGGSVLEAGRAWLGHQLRHTLLITTVSNRNSNRRNYRKVTMVAEDPKP